jgi:hypothetical protein
MSSDPESTFLPADPAQWRQTSALPRIIVRPKQAREDGSGGPYDDPALDGIDDWFVPTRALADTSYPDDWFVPAPPATPNLGQLAAGAQADIANSGSSNLRAGPADPLAAYWSLVPASRVGAMAWHPPIFLADSPNVSSDNSATSV